METEKKKMPIWKKVVYGIASLFILIIVLEILFPFDYYKHGMEEFKKGNFEKATEFLAKVKSNNIHFNDAKVKLDYISMFNDSIKKVKESHEIEVSKKIEEQNKIETEKNLVEEKIRSKTKMREKFKENCLSSWDGSCSALEKYIKDNLKDPDSYKHVNTEVWDKEEYSLVKLTYRAKNSFGGYVVSAVSAKVSWDCELLEIVEVTK